MVAPQMLRAAAALSSSLTSSTALSSSAASSLANPTSTTANATATAVQGIQGTTYSNPYDATTLSVTWPGTPTAGETSPPPQPPTPFPYGGASSANYVGPAFIPKSSADSLVAALPSQSQVGDSNLGNVDSPRLDISLPGAQFSALPLLPTLSKSAAAPSSTAPADTACPTMPDTGVTRTYALDVAYQTIAPDGVPRNALLFNGQFPGPLVEANWGDWIEFQVTNHAGTEGTTVHAHGLLQQGTPWYDGVPAVSQCPIEPNATATQTFRADRYGTSWYHSHYSAQYSGGAQGPMIIHGPKNGDYDIDVGPVFIEDWFHADYYALVQDVMAGNVPLSNNNLINGKMNYPCANTSLPCTPNAGVAKFSFERGQKHLLRLINSGAEGLQKFSIDNHTLTVVATDFVPVQPYQTNVVTLGIGQRTDVIVEANATGDAFWMRAQLGTNGCTLNDGISPNALAAVYYLGADTSAVPNTTSDVTPAQLAFCENDPLNATQPVCPIAVATPTTTEQIDITFHSNGTNFLFYVGDNSFRGDYNAPILLDVNQGNLTFEPEWNVHNYGSNATVRLVLYNHALAGGHPMHLHGHDFQVLAQGVGTWDGNVAAANPIRRDVHFLPIAQDASTPAFIVLQFAQDNPGAWPLHCHIAWHVSSGLFMTVLERPDDIQKLDIDQDQFALCSAWDLYTSEFPPDQIDSGLKEKEKARALVA